MTAEQKAGITEEGARWETYRHLVSEQREKKQTELLFAMADMDATRYETLKYMDIFEFYTLFDLWQKRIEEKNKAIQAKQSEENAKSFKNHKR